ncbi:PASTA domain-containing protein [Paenibacillus filicis]|uniref:PASTA domain-containing protein n=1 Tax=Paenibacillus filicis TaxID=669464 RepID=A0ABU9DK09_9BACL
MEKTLRARYVLQKPILPSRHGMLFAGTDLSLRRDIAVFVSEQPSRIEQQAYMRLLQAVAHYNDNRFLHLLDVGVEDLSIYAVLKSHGGEPLSFQLKQKEWKPLEAAAAAAELGRGILDAEDKGVAGFSVLADNIWLGEGMLKVINYWEKAEEHAQGSRGLALLVLQLACGSEVLPSHEEGRELWLRAALAGELAAGRQSEPFIALLREALDGELPLRDFVEKLALLAGKPASVQPPHLLLDGDRLADDAGRGLSSGASEALSSLRGELSQRSQPEHVYAAGPPTKAVSRKAEPAEEEDMEDEEETRSLRPIGRRIVRKTILGFTLAGVAVVSAVGVFFVFLEMGAFMGKKPAAEVTEELRPHVSDSQQGKGQPSASGKVTDKSQETSVKPAAPANQQQVDENAETVPAPQLIGLNRQEAEKTALAYGLKYEFFLESNPNSANTVFRQSPAPGTVLAKGESVSFWISKGQ